MRATTLGQASMNSLVVSLKPGTSASGGHTGESSGVLCCMICASRTILPSASDNARTVHQHCVAVTADMQVCKLVLTALKSSQGEAVQVVGKSPACRHAACNQASAAMLTCSGRMLRHAPASVFTSYPQRCCVFQSSCGILAFISAVMAKYLHHMQGVNKPAVIRYAL